MGEVVSTESQKRQRGISAHCRDVAVQELRRYHQREYDLLYAIACKARGIKPRMDRLKDVVDLEAELVRVRGGQ